MNEEFILRTYTDKKRATGSMSPTVQIALFFANELNC